MRDRQEGPGGLNAEAVRVQGAVQLLMDCLADIVDHEGLDVLPAMSQVRQNGDLAIPMHRLAQGV